MSRYQRLSSLLGSMNEAASDAAWAATVVPYLTDIWLDEYTDAVPGHQIVEVSAQGFSYLFDIPNARLIAAWGVSRGRHDGARDKSRMAGHPLGGGPLYHRGHAIPHTLGGGTDINLVAQLGKVNVGAFRPLERQAVATPGALYFTYWMYRAADDKRPTSVEQGLLLPRRREDIRLHEN